MYGLVAVNDLKSAYQAEANLKPFLCISVILPDPFPSIVEKHMQWDFLFFEVCHKVSY